VGPDLFEDRCWRLDNLYSIVNKEGRVVPFKLNWAQRHAFVLSTRPRTRHISTFGIDGIQFKSATTNVAAGASGRRDATT
jgi:hypothetical protein